jgi:uncharacterized pyridoxamine 5'-phosphate oxidase family protein
MDRDEIIKFLNEHPACHLATAEGGQPRVRGMLMYRADKQGIIFQTGDTKPIVAQIRKNPRVEACFNDFQKNIQIRVMGRAEIVEDQKLKEEIVAARDFLKPLVKEKSYGMIVVFRMTGCRASVWTFADNFNPSPYVAL